MPAVMAILGFGSLANATLLTFEDHPSPIPAGYGGLTWNRNLAVIPSASYRWWGNTYPPPSGDYVVANNARLSISITSAADFNFNGAYFAAFGQNNLPVSWTSTEITIEGYNNGSLVDSVSAALAADAFGWVQADLLGVDELRLISNAQGTSGAGTWWLMDNFTLNESSPVPEPTTVLLFGTGLAALAGGWMRKRQA